jgi:hypothetical protein
MANRPMIFTALSIYSWSLFQFTLNLVVTRGRSSGALTDEANKSTSENESANSNKKRANNSSSMHNELWNVMITLMMVNKLNFNNISLLFFFFLNNLTNFYNLNLI